MVRFSDFVGPMEKAGAAQSPDRGGGEGRLWLSDSQMLRMNGEDRLGLPKAEADEMNREVRLYYERFLERAVNVRERVVNDRGISPSPILSDLHHVLDHHLTDGLYEYAMSLPDDGGDMTVHTVDVTFASLKIGIGMAYDTKMLLRLGLAAFLENVGMYKVPEAILKKQGRLDPGEMEVMRRHPETGSRLLAQMGARYQWLAEVALQVHERADGSGYPRGLKGDEITEPAAIIGLIDVYVALIKRRPYRDRLIQPDAVRFIIKDAKGLFPAKILKTFLNQISLFPVNTYVRLNNKSIGRVVSTDKNQPLKPTIEVLLDGQGRRKDKREIIRLADNPLLYIVESIAEEDVIR